MRQETYKFESHPWELRKRAEEMEHIKEMTGQKKFRAKNNRKKAKRRK